MVAAATRALRVGWMMVLLSNIGLAGCMLPTKEHYEEKHVVTHLTVILMDEDSLQHKWREVSGKPSSKHVSLTVGPDQLLAYDNTVRGFFDFTTNTIYCPRMNFEVCGHELFHAIIGRFHPEQ